MSVQLRVVYLLLCGAALAGCQRELPLPVTDTTYYPIEAGKYRTYHVQDTLYTTGSGPEGVTVLDSVYYRREVTTDTVVDLLGRTVWWLELYHAAIDSATQQPGEFTFLQLWTQWKDGRFAERIEGNIRYQVLALPAYTSRAWNGNEWNDQNNNQGGTNELDLQFTPTSFRYLSVDSTVTLPNDVRYEHCYVVQWRQSDPNSILYDVLTWEVYAPGIGLVYRFDRYKKRELRDATSILSTSSYVQELYLVDHNY